MRKNYNQKEPKNLANIKSLIENYCTKEWQYLIGFYKSSKEYEKNEIIFSEGESIKTIHIIETGKVKIYSAFEKDKERIVRLAADDQVIGHRGIGEDFTYSVSASTLASTKVNLIPIDLFKSVLKANNIFCYYFMLFFAEELRRSERQFKNMENATVLQKISKALIMNLEAFGYDKDSKDLLSYTLSRKDLSSFTGSTYESIVRTLSWLNENRIIQTDGKNIRILEEEKLRKMMVSIDA